MYLQDHSSLPCIHELSVRRLEATTQACLVPGLLTLGACRTLSGMPRTAAGACVLQKFGGCSADLCGVEAVSQDFCCAPGKEQCEEVELQSVVSHSQQLHRSCLDRLRRLLHNAPQRPVPRQYLDDCTRTISCLRGAFRLACGRDGGCKETSPIVRSVVNPVPIASGAAHNDAAAVKRVTLIW